MNNTERVRIGKFLSYVLRHAPHDINLSLDSEGWANIDELINKANQHSKYKLTRENLDEIVKTNNKARYAISEDGLRIRAHQGHSVEVTIAYKELEPPEFLYHGTSQSKLLSIRQDGLKKMSRHHVHLSADRETAASVGRRHNGKEVVLLIFAKHMYQMGHKFYRSDNGVWLIDGVPPRYIVG